MILVLFTFGAGTYWGLRSAVIAGCFFIWNDIFRPTYWGRHYGVLGSAYFKPVHICTTVLIVSAVLHRGAKRWNYGTSALLFLIGWMWLSAVFAWNSEIAYKEAIEKTKYMLPMAYISLILTDRASQKLFAYTLAASVGVWLVHHGVLAAVTRQPLIDMAIPGGQMSDRNDFLVAGTACVPLLAYVGWHHVGIWQRPVRWIGKIGTAVTPAAYFYSLSRGAMVGLGMLVVYYALGAGRAFKGILIGALLLLLLLPLVPTVTWERLGTINLEGEQEESSARSRVEQMRIAWQVTLRHPLLGCGADNFPRYSRLFGRLNADPHSIWLKCSSEYGLPMLAFFVYTAGRMLNRLRRAAREATARGDRDTERFAVALACAIFGFLAAGTFTSQFMSQYLWALVGLAGAFLATPADQRLTHVPGSRLVVSAEDLRALTEQPEPAGAR
jgi:hypothetical protein